MEELARPTGHKLDFAVVSRERMVSACPPATEVPSLSQCNDCPVATEFPVAAFGRVRRTVNRPERSNQLPISVPHGGAPAVNQRSSFLEFVFCIREHPSYPNIELK